MTTVLCVWTRKMGIRISLKKRSTKTAAQQFCWQTDINNTSVMIYCDLRKANVSSLSVKHMLYRLLVSSHHPATTKLLHQPCSQGLSLLPLVGFVSQSKGNLLHVQSWSLDMNWVDAGRRIFPALSDVSASSTLAWVLIDKLMKKASINTSIKSPVDRPF